MHHREHRGHGEKKKDDCGDSLSVPSVPSVVKHPMYAEGGSSTLMDFFTGSQEVQLRWRKRATSRGAHLPFFPSSCAKHRSSEARTRAGRQISREQLRKTDKPLRVLRALRGE